MSRRSGRSTRAAALALLLLLALARGGRAQPTGASSARGPGRPPYSIGVTLSRAVVKLGEPAIYRGWITGGDPARVRFLAPVPSETERATVSNCLPWIPSRLLITTENTVEIEGQEKP